MSDPEFPDRAALESNQLALLRSLLTGLVPGNRFYSAKLAAAGVSADPSALDQFLAEMPFTLKQELVEDQISSPPYGTNLSYAPERYTRYCQTSGTSGSPLRWLDTTESWSWMVDNWVRVMLASGVQPGDRIFFAFSYGPFLGFWTAFEAGVRIGCLCLPGGGMSSAARLRTMLENRVTVLCCTPTYAVRLAEVAAEEGIDLSRGAVRSLIVAGEPGAGIPATRARIEAMWPGARLHDHHGMTEIGPVSFECPVRAGVLHILESAYIPEIIDPESSRRAAPGEQGELVLTNLGRLGSPLLRYRTGDLVRGAAGSPCACGRSDLALEGGILGRVDDMFCVRGINVYPRAVEEVVRGFDAIAEFQVEVREVRGMPEITVRIETVPGCPEPAGVGRHLESALRSALTLRIPVEPVPPGTLPRFELKAKRWIRTTA